MKKLITLFAAAMLLAAVTAKAQNPQPPAKKSTAKPVTGGTPKANAYNAYLPIGGIQGDPTVKRANTSPVRNTNATTTHTTTYTATPGNVRPANQHTKRTRP